MMDDLFNTWTVFSSGMSIKLSPSPWEQIRVFCISCRARFWNFIPVTMATDETKPLLLQQLYGLKWKICQLKGFDFCFSCFEHLYSHPNV